MRYAARDGRGSAKRWLVIGVDRREGGGGPTEGELENIVKDPCTRTVKTRQARSVGQWRVASGDVVRRDGASGWQCRCHAPLLGACDTQHDSPGDPTDLVLATTSSRRCRTLDVATAARNGTAAWLWREETAACNGAEKRRHVVRVGGHSTHGVTTELRPV